MVKNALGRGRYQFVVSKTQNENDTEAISVSITADDIRQAESVLCSSINKMSYLFYALSAHVADDLKFTNFRINGDWKVIT